MKVLHRYVVPLSIWICCCFTITFQQQQQQQLIIPNRSNLVSTIVDDSNNPLKILSKGSEAFALEIFKRLSDTLNSQSGLQQDFMISPFSIWSLLLLLTEGAAGNTLYELRKTLRISSEQVFLREIYRRIQAILTVKTNTIEVSTLHAIFSDINRPVDRDYEDILTRSYKANLLAVDFRNTIGTAKYINDFVHNATRGLIDDVLKDADLIDAQMVMISAIYFRGQWKQPFNESNTKKQPFYDENMRVVANVDMMTQTASFPFTTITELDSNVLELPYGNENRLSMVIFLPKKGVPLSSVIDKLAVVGVTKIFTELQKAADMFEDDEVEVFLPKFSTTTDFTLNVILEQMGIYDLFDASHSNLSKISVHPIYLSRLFHKTKIEVTEEGTVASAVTGGSFVNKSIPPRFNVNRPFAYMIVEKSTGSLLFCGQVKNPTTF